MGGRRQRTTMLTLYERISLSSAVARIPSWARRPVARLHRATTTPANRLAMDIKPQSMLHRLTLLRLYHYAYQAKPNAILELGAFTGAATVVMAKAQEASGSTAPLISVELGGHRNTRDLPSLNIIADLHATLHEYDVQQRVRVVEGLSRAATVSQQVSQALNGHRIGLLFIDTDNDVAGDFSTYKEHLADNAILGIDDYLSNDKVAALKATSVRTWVDGMIASGKLLSLGVVPWGTWFGRLAYR
jgi:predicted O-methyltransferase YrrM